MTGDLELEFSTSMALSSFSVCKLYSGDDLVSSADCDNIDATHANISSSSSFDRIVIGPITNPSTDPTVNVTFADNKYFTDTVSLIAHVP